MWSIGSSLVYHMTNIFYESSKNVIAVSIYIPLSKVFNLNHVFTSFQSKPLEGHLSKASYDLSYPALGVAWTCLMSFLVTISHVDKTQILQNHNVLWDLNKQVLSHLSEWHMLFGCCFMIGANHVFRDLWILEPRSKVIYLFHHNSSIWFNDISYWTINMNYYNFILFTRQTSHFLTSIYHIINLTRKDLKPRYLDSKFLTFQLGWTDKNKIWGTN